MRSKPVPVIEEEVKKPEPKMGGQKMKVGKKKASGRNERTSGAGSTAHKGGFRKKGTLPPIDWPLTVKQQTFIEALADNPLDKRGAAIKAGVAPKSADSMSWQWLDPNRYPHVRYAYEKLRAERALTSAKKPTDILQYIHTIMYFSPADYFDPGGDGGWLITKDEYRKLPYEIKSIIEEIELRTIKTEDGDIHKLWVRFVAKSKAMELAAKHQLGEKINITSVNVNWDILSKPPERSAADDIELLIESVERKSLPPSSLPDTPATIGANGTH